MKGSPPQPVRCPICRTAIIQNRDFSTALQTFRIREACRRLSPRSEGFSNYTIEAVAESVGFRSRSNFHSIFKKITGLTPSQYQKLARKENV